MPTMSLKTPCAGKISNYDKVCNPAHYPCPGSNGTALIDYGNVSSLTNLYLYTTNVQSAYFVTGNLCCWCNSYSLKVTLYAQTGGICAIGWVVYGHIAAPASLNGKLISTNPNGTFIGNPTSCCSCDCWDKVHIHHEIGALNATSMGHYSFTCQQVLPAQSLLYYWNYPNCPV